jgi:hypothetical protein
MIAMLVACSSWAGTDGELWLRIEETATGGDTVRLSLPVTSLRAAGEPVTLDTPTGAVDLRAEARRLRSGAERTWTSTDGETVRLVNVAPTGGPAASVVAMGITGAKGAGLEVTFPLEPAALGEVDAQVHGTVDVDVNGLSLDLDDDACAQLRRSPPTTLIEILGPKGNGLRIRSL